jgi:two-component system, OmpR family, sensor histidine kinase SaeS
VIGLALAVAVASLGVGLAVTLLLRLLPSLRLQIASLALVTVVLPLAVVFVSGWVMFHMGDDVKILAVAAASACAAVGAGLALSREIGRNVDRLRDASAEFAGGNLAARAPTDGPAELAELGASFNAMAEHLGELFDARRELVAMASHDLRTPVASISVMLEAIADGVATADEYLPALRDHTRRLARLIDEMFELATLDAGALAIERRATNLTPLIDGCLRGIEADARAKNIALERRLPASVEATCDGAHVERILYNLLTNALRHTPADGAIAVAAADHPDEVEISVEDTGDGVAAGTEGRVFDRFWRGDRARTAAPGEGAGLGLAIARALVEAQGGRIWLERRESGGTRFSFTLPNAAR